MSASSAEIESDNDGARIYFPVPEGHAGPSIAALAASLMPLASSRPDLVLGHLDADPDGFMIELWTTGGVL